MSDKEIKIKLKSILANTFKVSEDKIVTNRTTDLIVKLGDNESDWLYFEVKSTNKDERKNSKVYFGATSLNQIIEANKHPLHYYYILVSGDSNHWEYGIATPDNLLSYMTGLYEYVDFSIPENEMKEVCVDENTFSIMCRKLQSMKPVAGLIKSHPNEKRQKKIDEMNSILKTKIKWH